MEQSLIDQIETHRHNNYQLNKLYNNHFEYEKQIEVLEKSPGLSAKEQKLLHELKKKKLAEKEELLNLLKEIQD